MIKRNFIEELFQRLEKLPKRTSGITAYGSDIDMDGEVLMDTSGARHRRKKN